MVSTCSLIYNLLWIIPSELTRIGLTTMMFYTFSFSSLVRYKYLYLFSEKVYCLAGCIHLFIYFCWLSLGLFVWLRLRDMFVSENRRKLCASRSPGHIPVVNIPCFCLVKFQFLIQLPVDHFPHTGVSRKDVEMSWCPSWSNSLWQGWSCGLVHCPAGNATDPIWRCWPLP